MVIIMEYVLKARSIFKKYGDENVLNNLTINVPKGAIYGLIGKNGAGKTTLIRIICGLQEPTSGDYSIYEYNYKDENILKSRKRMGAVVETPAIYLNLSAKENIMHQYRVLGLPSFDGVDSLLKMVGLGDVGKKKTRQFSLGMKQRLGIAIALVGNPDFIVLDEPINGLDPQGIIELRELLIKLNQEKGITILISSHILGELSRVATWYGFVDRGRIVKEISAKELDEKCRKCMQLTVDNINNLVCALDKEGIEYEILSNDKANIFSKISITKLSDILKEGNCQLISVIENDETLESFYMNLVGK